MKTANAMQSDPYTILGVQRTSSTEDIKKAFRALAMKHHPDRAGGNEARFKEISEAYAFLNKHHVQQMPGADQPFHGSAFTSREEMMRHFQEMQKKYREEEAERAKTRADRVAHTETVTPNFWGNGINDNMRQAQQDIDNIFRYNPNTRTYHGMKGQMTAEQARQAARDILRNKGINL